MKKLAGIILLVAAAPALADSDTAAFDLAGLLAAEQFCGLTYDQAAIQAWIERNVAADDMSFSGKLNLFVAGKKFEQGSLSASEKIALCSQAARVAKNLGLAR